MSYENLRMEQAAKILQGFCANSSVFAYNSSTGWGLVNVTNKELVSECYALADELLKQGAIE